MGRFVGYLVVVLVHLGEIVHYFVYLLRGVLQKIHHFLNTGCYALMDFGHLPQILVCTLDITSQSVAEFNFDITRICLDRMDRLHWTHRIVCFLHFLDLLGGKSQKLEKKIGLFQLFSS